MPGAEGFTKQLLQGALVFHVITSLKLYAYMYTYIFRKIQNIIPYEFSNLFSVVSLFCWYPPLSPLKPPLLPHVSPQVSILLFRSPTPWPLFTFLTSSVLPVLCSHLEMRNWEPQVRENMRCWVSSGSGLHHSIQYFLLPTVYLKVSFFFRAEWYSIVQMYDILIVQSSAEEHFNCFYFLVFVNRMQ